jgi:hypothetical protein
MSSVIPFFDLDTAFFFVFFDATLSVYCDVDKAFSGDKKLNFFFKASSSLCGETNPLL